MGCAGSNAAGAVALPHSQAVPEQGSSSNEEGDVDKEAAEVRSMRHWNKSDSGSFGEALEDQRQRAEIARLMETEGQKIH